MSQIIKPGSGGGGGAVSSVTGSNGVTASPTTGSVVVSGLDATTTTLGVASFNGTEFSVTSGAVSLKNGNYIATITGNDGTPESPTSAGNFTFDTANATVKFLGSANTEKLDFGISTNLCLGNSMPNVNGSAVDNVGLGTSVFQNLTGAQGCTAVGQNALNAVTTSLRATAIGNGALVLLSGAADCTACGAFALESNVSGNSNCAFGSYALSNCTSAGNSAFGQGAASGISSNNGVSAFGFNTLNLSTGANNTAFGTQSMQILTSGASNTAIGMGAAANLLTGSNGIYIGLDAGNAYVGAESNNIIIGSPGVATENHVIRIGTAVSQTECFVAGITGTTPTSGNTPQVVLCDNAGQLTVISSGTAGDVLTSNGAGVTPSFQVPSGGSGITTINGNSGSGSVTGSTVTLTTANTTVKFVASGTTLTQDFGISNLILGSLPGSITGGQNAGLGLQVFASMTSGNINTALGYQSSISLTTGTLNAAFGAGSLLSLVSGTANTAFGNVAGSNYTGSESYNTLMNNVGIVGESNVTRIGRTFVNSSNPGAQYNYSYGILATDSGRVVNTTSISGTTYSTLSSDYVIFANSTSNAINITLNTTAVTGTSTTAIGTIYRIKDVAGTNSLHNITLTPASGTIDGQTSYTMVANFQSVDVCYNGTNWSIL
jgi:hypothetical protein